MERCALKILDSGEGYTIEYKTNRSKLSSDVYETVSSFSNRYGGHILLGVTEVEKDGYKVGQVTGVDKDKVYDMKRNFINLLNDPNMFSPTLYLELEEFDYDGMTVLWTYVPPTSQICYCNKKAYDRNDDADQNITTKISRLAEIITRKSADYREQQILPYANESHLKMELMDRVREMVKGRDKDHPWKDMDDMEIMRSAGLYVENIATGESGFNLAAVLLFGKPEVIQSCVPGYKTDAIYRVENIDRYDDREIVTDNLIEAYDKLMAFCEKHMDNRFVLDGDVSVDARKRIAREVIGNTLIHRDYSSAYPAKMIIEKDVLRTENWSKSRFNGVLSLESFSPYPKNPLLASFFVNIGRADTLGSGMRNLFKYTNLYSHADPVLIEGDVFEVIIPFSSEAVIDGANHGSNHGTNGANLYANESNHGANESNNESNHESNESNSESNHESNESNSESNQMILSAIMEDPKISQRKMAEMLGISRSTIQRAEEDLKQRGIIVRVGGTRGYWEVKKD